MNKFLSLAVLALLPAFATAETSLNLVCDSLDKSTIVVVEKLSSTTAADQDGPASATLLIVKLKGQNAGERIQLKGEKMISAKGVFFQLTGANGAGLFLAAAASKSLDEVSVGGNITEIVCSGR